MKAIISAIIFLFIMINVNPLLGQSCPHSTAWNGYQKQKCDQYRAKKQCRFASTTGVAWLDKDIIRIMDNKTFATRYLRKISCPTSGTVSYQEVEFDHHRAEFITVDHMRNRQSGQSCRLQCLQGKDDPVSINHRT